ncbi:hypothetical protein [Mycobacterium sp. DL592]|uniref:hypothetical protein n=1 Tax=Mycobacterium sp. DL592 TaxID=2675524 RepID=UPI00142224C7|nr:hypothetical protein [Mycobacterium sp. DL592]
MTFDVVGRLDQGRQAVADTQTYVTACHLLGYSHPDLTAYAAQVLEWYGTEDGLDLDVLDSDCAAVRAMADTAEDALRMQHDALRGIAEAWNGDSGSVAGLFVERHCQAGAAVAGALRAAADSCAQLRDTLLRVVDEKVHTATAIDDRVAAQRPAWLAAARTVMSAAPDRAEAADVVVHQITPYVDADIRTEWVTAMRSATSAVESAYADAIRQVTFCGPVVFAVPGQLFVAPPQPAPLTAAPAAAPLSMPAAAVSPVPPEAVNARPATPAPLGPAPSAPETALSQQLPPPQAGDPLGSGAAAMPAPAIPSVPDVGGGLTGLGGQLADAIGTLLASASHVPADTAVPDTAAADDLADAEPESAEPQTDPAGTGTEDQEGDPPDDTGATGEATTTEPVEESVAEQTAPAPLPPADPQPPVIEPEPEIESLDEKSPCEIAADELAQVGQ